MQAVILAAGLGLRLGVRSEKLPKGFIPMGGSTLIERSLRLLRRAGIHEVLIGTGHLGECYEKLALKGMKIECVRNPLYDASGSLETLCVLRSKIRGGFLLLESDLLYESKALAAVLSSRDPDVVLASGLTRSQDEVYIEASGDGTLRRLSKDKSKIRAIAGEFVGISRISLELYERICEWTGKVSGRPSPLHYEDALTASCEAVPIRVLKVENLVWTEVDCESHLIRARKDIWPKLKNSQHADIKAH